MSKLENNIINNIKMLSLDMIKEAGSGNVKLSLSSSLVFYTLFMEHLKFDIKNPNWINRDRLKVTNEFLPVMYSTLHMFGYDVSLDNLKEFKKVNSNTLGYASPLCAGIEIGSHTSEDVISSSVGVALGERYLESLVKDEKPKCNLIDFKTYCVCSYNDLMSGLSYESLAFAGKEKLNKFILIVVKNEAAKDSKFKETESEDIVNRLKALQFNIIELKGNNIGALEDAIDEAKDNEKPTIILIKNGRCKELTRDFLGEFHNKPLTNEEMNSLREKYKIENPFSVTEDCYEKINKHVNKRLNKELIKWLEIKNTFLNDLKIKEVIEFLETKNVKVNFNSENIKINDSYEEELLVGNSKIFNILASKSPFILSGSSGNFIHTKCNISESNVMSKENPTGRNIYFGNRTLAMGGIVNGLASLGFKMFVSAPLIDSNFLRPFIRFSSEYNLPVNYIFSHDTFLNSYEDMGISGVDEINSLRIIPNLITFRPADINEIIGIYNILANYKKSSAIIIGNEKIKKLMGTNPKYVVAGAYRAKREKGEANGIIIATGSEVSLALKIADELLPYGIDFRVITMPSQELFELQNERYKYSLLPKELKTFVIEFGSGAMWHKYATNEDYVFGINKYSTSGTKEELLNYYNLDADSIKTKIIELMKK